MKENVRENGRGIAATGLAAAICLTAWQGFAATDTPWLKGVTDKDPLTYRCGEKIVFTLTLERAETLPSGLDIVWTRTGAPPPTTTRPTFTLLVSFRRFIFLRGRH